MSNPNYNFCECESGRCTHNRTCGEKENLANYTVDEYRQTLCPGCANHAHTFCKAYGWAFEIGGDR